MILDQWLSAFLPHGVSRSRHDVAEVYKLACSPDKAAPCAEGTKAERSLPAVVAAD
jgi:hypothetical protein